MRKVKFPSIVAAFCFGMTAGCARPVDVKAPNADLITGPDEFLGLTLRAAQECGYTGVELTTGSHLAPMVIVRRPAEENMQYLCLREWLSKNRPSNYGDSALNFAWFAPGGAGPI